MRKSPITLEWVTFYNSTALESGLLIFKDAIDATEPIDIWMRSIRDAGMGYYILTYKSREQAIADYNAFDELYNNKDRAWVIPKMVTIFEYHWVSHIAISVEEKVDKNKGLIGAEYRWFVIDPIIFKKQKQVQELVRWVLEERRAHKRADTIF
jgi:hypothetical protein